METLPKTLAASRPRNGPFSSRYRGRYEGPFLDKSILFDCEERLGITCHSKAQQGFTGEQELRACLRSRQDHNAVLKHFLRKRPRIFDLGGITLRSCQAYGLSWILPPLAESIS